MKRSVLLTMGLILCLATTQLWAQASQNTFEKLKSLEGDWAGEMDGKPVQVTYKLMSNGSALVETLQPENEPSMVSVYHLNNDMVMMTHYCSSGNQPRMSASSNSDTNAINFSYVDATNLKSERDGHMQALQIIFDDENNIRQIWTWQEGDKQKPGTFKLKRKA